MKKLTSRQLKKLVGAMSRGTTGKVVEKDGVIFVEVAKTPWSALEPFFPKGWTKDEIREALNYELIVKPYAKEIYRLARERRSRLSHVIVDKKIR